MSITHPGRRDVALKSSPDVAAARRETCRLVRTDEDLDLHHGVRRAVFVHEQGLFRGSDRDPLDESADVVHVLGLVDGVAAGAVRLYPCREEDPRDGLWKGDRLAVLPGRRAGHLGAALVRFAVSTAGALGGRRMRALVQAPNEVFFHRLGWSSTGGPVDHLGVPHVRMEIALGP
ncbi:GNAT family N-acetyltransferase [Pseudonocardia kujensis]|uniref:MSMEG_0567/Sll0786 family nitrogen starvation N-acetyltransferase n=1 Tax=Pseudonocardia kujensis TaxID=1128675 RepID=UPI001E3F689E|nr:MSMEG_0567/Sll0786 family nitrogen starvation N-acetyltransferase [Pseudonocardia kujensis]MCE0764281.1 GNAT family N-acetyltransferase [Pseudonocardia kujensis]